MDDWDREYLIRECIFYGLVIACYACVYIGLDLYNNIDDLANRYSSIQAWAIFALPVVGLVLALPRLIRLIWVDEFWYERFTAACKLLLALCIGVPIGRFLLYFIFPPAREKVALGSLLYAHIGFCCAIGAITGLRRPLSLSKRITALAGLLRARRR